MTPRERLNRFTEETQISLGVVLLSIGLLTGGIIWITTISIQANDSLETSHRLEKKQDRYEVKLQEILLSLQEIQGELKRIKK